MKKLTVMLSALVVMASCASTPEELLMESYEIANIEMREKYIEYQEEYIKLAEQTLNLNDKEFAEFAKKSNCELDYWMCVNRPDEIEIDRNPEAFPEFIRLCRDKDRSLAEDIDEAYLNFLEVLGTKQERVRADYDDWDEDGLIASTTKGDYAKNKAAYIATKLGKCAYECELAMAELYIDYIETYTDFIETAMEFTNHNVYYRDIDKKIGKEQWKELTDASHKLHEKIDENYDKIYDLEWQIESRMASL